VEELRPLLERHGGDPDFHLVLFTVDETTFSREIAPLAGFYPSVYIGAPWWFLDAPDAILRFRAAVTETAGFYRGAGFVDDTRAFLSIPARHDMSRRLDAAFLARLVREGRLELAGAERIVVDLVDALPRRAFSCERAGAAVEPGSTGRRRRRRARAAAASHRAHRPGRVPPRAPGLVHRPRRRRGAVGDRRVHRPEPTGGAHARQAGRPVRADRAGRRPRQRRSWEASRRPLTVPTSGVSSSCCPRRRRRSSR